MKTLKILSLVTVLFFTGITIGQSKEHNTEEQKAVKELNQNLQKLFKDMPFEDIMCGKRECSISICFTVNNDSSLEFYHIIGQNQKLVDYSKEIFANEGIKADNSVLDDEIYWIKMVFKYKKF